MVLDYPLPEQWQPGINCQNPFFTFLMNSNSGPGCTMLGNTVCATVIVLFCLIQGHDNKVCSLFIDYPEIMNVLYHFNYSQSHDESLLVNINVCARETWLDEDEFCCSFWEEYLVVSGPTQYICRISVDRKPMKIILKFVCNVCTQKISWQRYWKPLKLKTIHQNEMPFV